MVFLHKVLDLFSKSFFQYFSPFFVGSKGQQLIFFNCCIYQAKKNFMFLVPRSPRFLQATKKSKRIQIQRRKRKNGIKWTKCILFGKLTFSLKHAALFTGRNYGIHSYLGMKMVLFGLLPGGHSAQFTHNAQTWS